MKKMVEQLAQTQAQVVKMRGALLNVKIAIKIKTGCHDSLMVSVVDALSEQSDTSVLDAYVREKAGPLVDACRMVDSPDEKEPYCHIRTAKVHAIQKALAAFEKQSEKKD